MWFHTQRSINIQNLSIEHFYILAPDSPADLSWMFMEEKQIGKKNDTFCHSSFLITWMVPQYASVTNEIKRYIVSWHQITDVATAAIHSNTVSLPGVGFFVKEVSMYNFRLIYQYVCSYVKR